ncbi:general secretion pathway protein M [bacterium BMS3Bbin06]|nr:general secretion pathway protein M [bacterium BMS3Abin08]GBE34895.1 general secretion pathway protein M [bacterium BMS3Bbin06]HDO36369.1 hypothetical protein [Nitrospirota bacterium]HDY71021.1 hypothetical protein [Nitrospirota bacterium]
MTTNRRRLIGIILIALLSIAVFYQYGVSGLRERNRNLREEKEIKIRTLTKYRALLSQEEALRKEVNELRSLVKDEELKLLSGDTPALASASLQGMVKRIITDAGATIRSERVERTEEHDGYRVVSVSVDLNVKSIAELSNIIYNIESRTPYMVMREMSIRVRNYRRPSGLTVRLKISGLSIS